MGINYWEVCMRKMKKLLSVLAVTLLIVCMAIPVSAAGKISKSKATLLTGQTLQLKLSGTKGKAKWTSSKKSVATVSSSGKVTAKKSGSATITAKVGKKKYSCKVTVESPKLSIKSITLKVGETSTVKVKGTKQNVKWKSSKKSVATVKNGKITAKKAGTANITATILGKKFTCKVTVKKASNGGFSGNTSTSKNNVTYHAEATPSGEVIILQNNYNYAVAVDISCAFCLNGQIVSVSNQYYTCVIEPGMKYATLMTNYGGQWDSVKINLKTENVSYFDFNAKNITYTSNRGTNGVILTVKNNGKNNRGTHMAVVYYKNGRIIGCDDNLFANVQSKGSTDYLESRYPTDSDYKTIIPDRYEVYVNMSYEVQDAPAPEW